MVTRLIWTPILALTALTPLWADDHAHAAHDMAREHGGGIFSKYLLEADTGAGPAGRYTSWDLDGWTGTDENKLWIKSEGELRSGKLEDGEVWALYSRNIATFWDAQLGVRRDFGPSAASYAVVGFTGLAPYAFETEAHLFLSDKGIVSARVREENNVLLTQKFILQPYAELNAALQDVPERHTGAGLTDGKIGMQARYEFTRTFAPYVDIHYGRTFGETSANAQSGGEDINETIGTVGLRLMF